jgi:Terpene cyclase DEP1
MKPKTMYVSLCFIGAVFPYWQFLPWLSRHGLSPALFFQELFVNRISSFFGIDVIVSALALLVFIPVESFRLGIRRWWFPLLATFVVGVSLGLPMFLYMRELKLERGQERVPN